MGGLDVFFGRILRGGCLYGDIDHGADFGLGGGMFPLLAERLGTQYLACFFGMPCRLLVADVGLPSKILLCRILRRVRL